MIPSTQYDDIQESDNHKYANANKCEAFECETNECETFEYKVNKCDLIKHDVKECPHNNVINESGSLLCIDCGLELNQYVTYEKDWKYNSVNDINQLNDPDDFILRKKDKSIYTDLQYVDISQHIKEKANDLYIEICKDNIKRRINKKCIILGCVFNAYKICDEPRNYQELMEIFKLTKKQALKGIKYVHENSPKNSPIRSIHITPEQMIVQYLNKFNLTDNKKKEIANLYNTRIKNKSKTLNRSRPMSVAAGIIWYWIKKNKIPMNIKEFKEKVGLSELTINKIAKIVEQLLNGI